MSVFVFGDSTNLPFIVWPTVLSLLAGALFGIIIMNTIRLYTFLDMKQQTLYEYTPLLLKTIDQLGQDTKFVETRYTTYQTQEQEAERSKKAHVTKKIDNE